MLFKVSHYKDDNYIIYPKDDIYSLNRAPLLCLDKAHNLNGGILRNRLMLQPVEIAKEIHRKYICEYTNIVAIDIYP